jgi:L-serine dehydratase
MRSERLQRTALSLQLPAADVVPAVIRYHLDHCIGAEPSLVPDFFLTAAAIGGLI